MSTQIQQQQVQGLVQAVTDITTISGNLASTGITNAQNLRGTGFALETQITNLSEDLITTGSALASSISSNASAIYATGSNLENQIGLATGNLALTGTTLSYAILSTGTTNYERLTAISGDLGTRVTNTGTQLLNAINVLSGSVNLTGRSLLAVSGSVDFISGRQNTDITDIAYVSGKLDAVSGELRATGQIIGPRVGVNPKVASNFGLPTGDDQLYGEVQSIPNYNCSTRQLQWVGDIPARSTAELYLGGSVGTRAQMPHNTDWAVKLVAHAKSIEVGDRRGLGHWGMYMLETGFLIDHEYSIAPHTYVSGVVGASGYAGSGVHYGVTFGGGGTTEGYLGMTGHNNYTGTVRFHVTANVSQMKFYS